MSISRALVWSGAVPSGEPSQYNGCGPLCVTPLASHTYWGYVISQSADDVVPSLIAVFPTLSARSWPREMSVAAIAFACRNIFWTLQPHDCNYIKPSRIEYADLKVYAVQQAQYTVIVITLGFMLGERRGRLLAIPVSIISCIPT